MTYSSSRRPRHVHHRNFTASVAGWRLPRWSCPLRTALVLGALLTLLLSSGLLPGRASAQMPDATCPPFTDITITQRVPGSGSLAVEMQPPLSLGETGAPDSQSFRLYYFIDRVAAIYPPDRGVQLLLGGDVLPDGSAQFVQRLTHGDVQTIDLQLPPGSHSVAAVLAVGDVTCHETRPQPDPCSYVCGPPRTLLIGAAEVDIGPPPPSSTPRAATQLTGNAARGIGGAVLLLGTTAVLALAGTLLRASREGR